jgi:hypothetical protein
MCSHELDVVSAGSGQRNIVLLVIVKLQDFWE